MLTHKLSQAPANIVAPTEVSGHKKKNLLKKFKNLLVDLFLSCDDPDAIYSATAY